MHSTEAELYTYKNTYQTETQILGGKRENFTQIEGNTDNRNSKADQQLRHEL